MIQTRTERALRKTLGTQSNLEAELNTEFGPVVSSALNNSFTAYAAFPQIRKLGGAGTGWRTRTGRNTSAGSMNETEGLSGSGKQTRIKMRADWKINKFEVGLTGLMEAESAGGMDNLTDLLDDEIVNGIQDQLNWVEQCIFGRQHSDTPDYSREIWDLPRLVNNGNAQAVYDKTRDATPAKDYLDAPCVQDNSGNPRPIEKQHIKDLKGLIYDAVGYEPDMIITTRTIGDSLEAVWESESRATPQEFSINAGFVVRKVYGIPVLRSQHCNPGVMYGLNMRDMEFRYLVKGQIEELGKTKDSMEFFVKTYEQLVAKNLRSHGKIADLQ